MKENKILWSSIAFSLSIAFILTKKIFDSINKKKLLDIAYDGNTVLVSAPGKVLIAGGYLVLERPHIGITLSISARFFASVRFHRKSKKETYPPDSLIILVKSPQFHTSYRFQYDLKSKSLKSICGENEFIFTSLGITLSFIEQIIGTSKFIELLSNISKDKFLDLELKADNDFYSQIEELNRRNLPLLSHSLNQLPKFFPCPKDENGNAKISKTGLGSSAALTTSLVGALLKRFDVISLEPKSTTYNNDLKIVHNLSQLVHAISQGKVGSGFDVSSAVYGSQIYQRFSPKSFQECIDNNSKNFDKIFDAVLSNTDNRNERASLYNWDQVITPFSLPDGFDLILGDVCGGASSSSMAKRVIQWKAENPVNAKKIWASLGDANNNIFRFLVELSNLQKLYPYNFSATISWASKRSTKEWRNEANSNDIIALLLNLKENFKYARHLLKQMGQHAGVDIEPDSQTLIVNQTESIKGVLCAGVPGAGGNDAIFAIVLSEEVRSNVENLWSTWSKNDRSVSICPLTIRAEFGKKQGIF